MVRRRKKTGNFYLKNENLLIYIHESKKSFCQYESKDFSDYDMIVAEDSQITKEMIEDAKISRANRINDIKGNSLFQSGSSNKEVEDWIIQNGENPENFSDDQVVFRRMTNRHIPDTIDKHGNIVKEKTNFPPFVHTIIRNGVETEVGWSHHQNGKFSISHGRVNNQLGKSFLELTNRFGNNWNWRNYSWLEEMQGQALVRLSVVALQFDESKSQNPFSWYTMVVERTFMHILQNEKKQLTVKRKIIESNPDLEFNQTFGDQAQQEIDSYNRDHNISDIDETTKKKKLYHRVSGKSLSQIKAEKDKFDLESNMSLVTDVPLDILDQEEHEDDQIDLSLIDLKSE